MNTQIKTSPDYTLTGSLLVVQYNEMVVTATDLGITGVKEVNRFATNQKGIERTEKLHAQITAAAHPSQDPAEVEADTGVHPLDQGDQSHVADDTVNHATTSAVAEETTTEASAPAETQDEEATERLPDETEEAYMARKAAKKKVAPKKKGGARNTEGPTIKSLTEEYNEIVRKMTKAQKEAAPFAKHHTSMFESKDKANIQLKKLRAAIAKA